MDSGCTSTTEVNDHQRQYCCSDDTATTMTSRQQQHHSKQLSSGTATVDDTATTTNASTTVASPKSNKSYTAVRKNSSARSINNANATTSKQSAVSRPELSDETGGTVTDDDTAMMSQSTLAAKKRLSKSSSKKLSKSSKLPATPKEAKAKTKRTSSRKPFISRMREFFQLGKKNNKSDKKSSDNSDDASATAAAATGGDSSKKTLAMLPFQSGVAAATAHNAKKGAHKHTRTVGNLEQQMANEYGSDSDNEANDRIDKSKTVVSPMVSPMALIASARATKHPTMEEHDEEQKRLSSFESIATGIRNAYTRTFAYLALH
jgi:hypothetical protein